MNNNLINHDVIKLLLNIIKNLIISIIVIIISFLGYTTYTNKQHKNTIDNLIKQYNEFINNFDVENNTIIDAKDGGNAGYIKNGGTINNGKDNSKTQS